MNKSRDTSATVATQRPSSAAFLLTMTVLDTTWRTMVPGIVGAVIGILLDKLLGTKPLFVLLGLALGIALSVVLILRLLKAVKR